MNREFWVCALYRALRTVCQTAVATIGTAMVVTEVDWVYVISASALAGLLSLLTSIATGLPEVDVCHEMTEEEAYDFIEENDEVKRDLDELEEYWEEKYDE